jgi:hypothetical protein
MNKSELFTHACKVNALRKEAQLPLRDIGGIIEEEENRLAWEEYGAAVERHRRLYEELREQLRQEYLQAGKGDLIMSAGGRWLLAYWSRTTLDATLVGSGHERPTVRGVQYGG